MVERLLGKIVMGRQASPDHAEDSYSFYNQERLAKTQLKEGGVKQLQIVDPRDGSP